MKSSPELHKAGLRDALLREGVRESEVDAAVEELYALALSEGDRLWRKALER